MPRGFAVLAAASFVILSLPLDMAGAQEDQPLSCTVLVDWGEDWSWDESGEYVPSVLHRYRVAFEPAFSNGSSPGLANVSVTHLRDGADIATGTSSLIAGGEIDIVLPEEPIFGDSVSISVSAGGADCNRELNITNWNQPIDCLLYTSPSPRD